MQIAAGQESFEDLGFDRQVDQPCSIEFFCGAPKALIQWSPPRVAWAVDSASWRLREVFVLRCVRLGAETHAYHRREPTSTGQTCQSTTIPPSWTIDTQREFCVN